MISGNRNRSPQCGAMGPGSQRHARNQNPFSQHQHQQSPQLMFMAGGRVGGYTQMARGFSMMPPGGPMHPQVMQCNMQQSYGGGYGYSGNSAPIFQQRHHYHQQTHQPPQPQMVHQIHQPQQNFINQPYLPPPQAAAPSPGLFSGIKDIVKGLIQPRNSDHHKYYNPKHWNKNCMGNLAAEMSYTPHTPQPRLQTVIVDLEVRIPPVNIPEKKTATAVNIPKPSGVAVPHKSPPKTTDVVAIFTSEDFPALPAPRRSRSITPAKTENTQEKMPKVQKETVKQKQASPPPPPPASSSVEHIPPKSAYFEIMCRTTPCGRRPTFGGRVKMLPPFSWNKSLRTCRTRCPESNNSQQVDCDTEDDSFVIFPKERPDDCLFSSFGMCRPPRQRQISECSDDSFVVFFTEDAEGLVAIHSDVDDDDDDDDDDDSDSDVETSSEEEDYSDSDSDEEKDNGTDVVDSSFLGGNKTDRNKYAGTTPFNPEVVPIGAEQPQLDSGFDDKRVTFNTKPVVHVMHAWNYAYRAARKGHWEDFARDRNRFKTRIERTSVYLNPILTPEHREKIYRSRFCEEAEQQPQQQQQQQTNTKSDT